MPSVGDNSTPSDANHYVRNYERLLVASLVLLVIATWRLWLAASPLPALCIHESLRGVSPWCDRLLVVALLSGCLWLLVTDRGRGWIFWSLTGLMMLDQLRCQAWAWHILLVMPIAAARIDAVWRLRGLRLLVLAIYVYSALSKCDATFAATLGQQFLEQITGWLGVDITNWPVGTRHWTAAMFPAFELLIPLLLSFRRTQLAGVVLAIAMHAGLALLLSPAGLGHSWGVVLWNLLFAAQTYLLFMPARLLPVTTPPPTLARVWPAPMSLLIGVVLPAFGLFSLWEPWQSWALYAPQRERVVVLISPHAVDQLPESLQIHARQPRDEDELGELSLDAWCLAETGAPLYPGTRMAAALALAVRGRLPPTSTMQVIVLSAANRWTNERKSRALVSANELSEFIDSRLIPAEPRWPQGN